MRILIAATVAVCAAARAGAAEDAAASAWTALQAGKLAAPQADEQVRALVSGLESAGLGNTAIVALSVLASRQDAAAQAAARELQRKAGQGGLALALAGRAPAGSLPPALAVRVARAHLENALVLAPPEEGSAFGALVEPPALTRASIEAPARAAAADAPVEGIATAVQRLARAQLERARQLAGSVPAGDAAEPEAHEVSALAALAGGDTAAAEKEFEALVRLPARGEAAVERREKAVLQLARLAYARGDDARAQLLYGRVSRAAPQWLDALFESSWSHFRRGEDEKALGNLLTLHAPFFQGRYFPESWVLKALVLYENCRYADARRALADFEARYRPLHDGLARALEVMPTAQRAVELLAPAPQPPLPQVGEAARAEIARLASTADLQLALKQVIQMAAELDSIDRRGAAFQRSALVEAVFPQVRSARLDLLQRTGERLRAAIAGERGELRELLGQALRLDYEIAGREKEMAAEPAPAPSGVARRRAPLQVEDDEELWPFQGEYWRDELGSYRFHLGERCARPPRPAPVQQAQKPSAAPPAAAAAGAATKVP